MNRRDFIALCATAPLAPSITRPNTLAEAINFERKGMLNDQMALTQDMLDQAEDAADTLGDSPPEVIIHGKYILIHGKLFRHEVG